MTRSGGLGPSIHAEELGSSGEPSVIPLTHPSPFLLVIYFSDPKKKGVRSDASSTIATFIDFVFPIPKSCSFFFNLFYRAARHRLNLVKVCLKGPQGTHFMSPCIHFWARAMDLLAFGKVID